MIKNKVTGVPAVGKQQRDTGKIHRRFKFAARKGSHVMKTKFRMPDIKDFSRLNY
jgi:hypothetical protein